MVLVVPDLNKNEWYPGGAMANDLFRPVDSNHLRPHPAAVSLV